MAGNRFTQRDLKKAYDDIDALLQTAQAHAKKAGLKQEAKAYKQISKQVAKGRKKIEENASRAPEPVILPGPSPRDEAEERPRHGPAEIPRPVPPQPSSRRTEVRPSPVRPKRPSLWESVKGRMSSAKERLKAKLSVRRAAQPAGDAFDAWVEFLERVQRLFSDVNKKGYTIEGRCGTIQSMLDELKKNINTATREPSRANALKSPMLELVKALMSKEAVLFEDLVNLFDAMGELGKYKDLHASLLSLLNDSLSAAQTAGDSVHPQVIADIIADVQKRGNEIGKFFPDAINSVRDFCIKLEEFRDNLAAMKDAIENGSTTQNILADLESFFDEANVNRILFVSNSEKNILKTVNAALQQAARDRDALRSIMQRLQASARSDVREAEGGDAPVSEKFEVGDWVRLGKNTANFKVGEVGQVIDGPFWSSEEKKFWWRVHLQDGVTNWIGEETIEKTTPPSSADSSEDTLIVRERTTPREAPPAQRSIKDIDAIFNDKSITTIEDIQRVVTPEAKAVILAHILEVVDFRIDQGKRIAAEEAGAAVEARMLGTVVGPEVSSRRYQFVASASEGKLVNAKTIAAMRIDDFLRTYLDYDLRSDEKRRADLGKFTNMLD